MYKGLAPTLGDVALWPLTLLGQLITGSAVPYVPESVDASNQSSRSGVEEIKLNGPVLEKSPNSIDPVVWYATPVWPLGPVVPVGPVGPVGPVYPVGPVGPVVPVGPVGPVGPTGPCGPAILPILIHER